MSSKKTKKTKTQEEPALGERNAITGYYSQYRVSASFIINALRIGGLRWIAVADPKAGRVDDFQIATENRVDAYQFKWSRYPGNFTFNDLIKIDKNSPSLIEQLASGWQHLRKLNDSKRIVVHLVTNETVSVSEAAILPIGDPPPEPAHFAAFIEQTWKPAHKNPHSSRIEIPKNWSVTWNALQKTSGLAAEEFELFVRDCELEFGRSLPQAENTTPRDAQIYENDLNLVTEKLFRAVYEPQQIIRLDRNELLDFLGWKRRFEFRNRHEFPVDEVLYQPIEESKHELERALAESESGYVAVLGSPGSGKSTLLTQTLRYFRQRIIRYYAFVPDAQSVNSRGESQNFLHDLVGAIENAGFRAGYSPRMPDVEQLREQLHAQLQLLHQDFLETHQKTIILVDGLDHIPREQHPIQSLLKDLPLPEQIPPGVLFVLGSQTDEFDDLPTTILSATRRPERRIEIEPLDREAIQSLIGKTGLTNFSTAEQIAEIERLSNGHPLALIYLLRQLEAADSPEKTSEILRQTKPYDGKIEDYYQSFWRGIDREDELADLLGLIARMRGGIDFNWIRSWADKTTVRRLQRMFVHLFRVEGNGKWYFFHNSFRLFLIDRTARARHGEFDETRNREIHLELAEKYAQSKEPHRQWEEIYHLYQGGADDRLLQKSSPAVFREQFFKFRSAEAIRADILLAISVAGRQHDIISFVRQMFADAETAQRENNTERLPIVPILISLGETSAALEYLRDGRRLRVSPKSALKNSIALERRGLRQEALAVFEMGEPLEYLSGAKELRNFYDKDEHELLEGWARAAAYFRPINKIIGVIRQITVETDKFARHAVADENGEISVETRLVEQTDAGTESDAATQKLQSELIYVAGLELLAQRRWDDLEAVKSALLEDEDEDKGNELCFSLQVHSWRFCHNQGDNERARRILFEKIEKIDDFDIDDSKRVVIAEGLFTVFGDKEEARRWLDEAQPLTPLTFSDFQVSFWDFRHLLRQARLLYAFGETRSVAELIPLPKQLKGQAAAYCQRGVCVIAEITASAWRGQTVDRAALRQKTFSLLRLFNRSGFSENRDEWSDWQPFSSGIKNEFYEELIAAIALHSIEAVQDLADDFAKEWDNNPRFWAIETIQRTTLVLYKNGASKGWAIRQFERLAKLIAEEETYARIEKLADFAAAWLQLGEPETARETLLQTLLDSSSTGEKDNQLNSWLEWLRSVNRLEPKQAARRVAWFAEAIVELERNGGPAADAAYDLLEIAFEWSPRRAVKLFLRFVERGIVNFNEAMKRLLRAALKDSGEIPEIAIRVLREFALPFASPDETIIELLVSRLSERSGKGVALEFAADFLAEVEIRALPENRKVWSRYVAEALIKNKISLSEVGLNEDVLKIEKSHSSHSELKLKDGSSLAPPKVRRRSETLAGLRELMQQEANGYFHWDGIVKDLLISLNEPAQVLEVADYFSGSKARASAPIINRAAKRLLELGDAPKAETLARTALSLSQQSGWAMRLGGGTKIEAHRTLVEIGGERMRRQAFDDLIRDLSGDYRYTSSILLDLDDILPVLTEQIPVKEVWAEVEQYVQNIFSSVESETVDSEWLDALNDAEIEDNPINALNDFVSSHIAHPVNVLAYAAQFVYLDLLLRDDEAAENYVRRLLGGNEREQEAVIMIVDAAGGKDKRIIEKFQDELQALAASSNFALRFIARTILSEIGISISLRTTTQSNASSLFKLILPSGRDFDEVWKTETVVAGGQILQSAKDSYEQLKIVLLELEVIASGTELPLPNVVERAAQIAARLAMQDEWCILGERKMQNLFNGANIKTNTYRKPHAIIARQALFHLVAELFDAGLLTDENLKHWKWLLDYYDPQTFFNRPVARPDFIAPISGWGQKAFIERQPAEIAEQLNLYAQDGTVVFGEYTKLKTLEWETPTVIRQSLICSKDFAPENEEERFFPRHLIVQIEDYPFKSGGDEAQNATVVWHWERMSDSPYTQWVAFNPELASTLGWNPSADKLFGWENESGEMMVWSVFWRDGLFDEQPPHFHNEVGEGWAVVGATQALKEITNHFKIPLNQKIRVEQHWRVDNEDYENSIVFEREVVENQSLQ